MALIYYGRGKNLIKTDRRAARATTTTSTSCSPVSKSPYRTCSFPFPLRKEMMARLGSAGRAVGVSIHRENIYRGGGVPIYIYALQFQNTIFNGKTTGGPLV